MECRQLLLARFDWLLATRLLSSSPIPASGACRGTCYVCSELIVNEGNLASSGCFISSCYRCSTVSHSQDPKSCNPQNTPHNTYSPHRTDSTAQEAQAAHTTAHIPHGYSKQPHATYPKQPEQCKQHTAISLYGHGCSKQTPHPHNTTQSI